MERTKLAILLLLLLALGVFIGSNYITSWIAETGEIINDIQRELILDHRNKMREVLKTTSDNLLFHIYDYEIDVTDNDSVLLLVNQYISALKNDEFGEIMLVRISPDGKILYDSYWGTTRSNGSGIRKISNEIVPQETIIEILDNNEEVQKYIIDNELTITEIEKIKEKYPNSYDLIARYINYKELSNVKEIFNEIKNGNSTNGQTNFKWELKSGEVQLLEWVTIPPGSLGFNDIPDSTWGVQNENHRWVLMMRSDKENILRNYKNIFKEIKEKIAVTKILYMFLIFIMISSIIIISYYIAILEKK
jgi:hypothetical protein